MAEVGYAQEFRPGPITFRVVTPVVDDELRRHVLAAQSLGLPLIEPAVEPKTGRLRVVANGPSASAAPLDDGVPTVALNGALRLFTDRGLAPTYWAACDPQEKVALFLGDAPEETEYLVATKCHPAVFESLLSRGRRVRVWNVADAELLDLMEHSYGALPRVSITLTALMGLFPGMGWKEFEVWGWDGSLRDGRRHAVSQDQVEPTVTICVGDQEFVSTPALAVEASEMVHALREFPLPITIHGDGMFQAIVSADWEARLGRMTRRPD